jgi:hypothetical protein
LVIWNQKVSDITSEKRLYFIQIFPKSLLNMDIPLHTKTAALKAAVKDERLPLTKEDPMKRYHTLVSLRLSGKILQVLLLILLLLMSCCS